MSDGCLDVQKVEKVEKVIKSQLGLGKGGSRRVHYGHGGSMQVKASQ